MNLSGITQGIKSFGKTVASDVLAGANAAERTLGGAYSKLTGRPGANGSVTATLAQRGGLLQDNAPGSQSMLVPPDGFLKLLAAPTAYSDRLVPTQQATQTPPSSSNVVSPTALTAALNGTQSTNTRAGNAFVPTPPAKAASAVAAPSSIGAASTPPTPVPMPGIGAASSSGTGFEATTPSGFSAAVPQAAILATLAAQPGRSSPSGYVATPESLQLGANPRRRIRDASGPTPQ